MQRTAIPKNLGHAARLWEWILLIAWAIKNGIFQQRGHRDGIFLVERTQGRNIFSREDRRTEFFSREDRGTEIFLVERTEGRNFLVERTEGQSFQQRGQRDRIFSREDRETEFFQQRGQRMKSLVQSQRESRDSIFPQHGPIKNGFFQKRWTKDILLVVWFDQEQILLVERINRFFQQQGSIRKGFFQQRGERDGFFYVVAWIDQERIPLEERAEGTDSSGSIESITNEFFNRYGPRCGFLKQCVEGRILSGVVKERILELAWVQRHKQGVLSGEFF